MRPMNVNIGPLHSSRGLVDVRFDGTSLELIRYSTPIELLDRYRWVLLGVAIVLAGAAVSVPSPQRWWLLVVAAALLVLLLMLNGGELVALASGRKEAARSGGTRSVIAEPDIHLMDPVYGAWRAHLVLHTTDGELHLSGWWWRRGQLDRLQRALAR